MKSSIVSLLTAALVVWVSACGHKPMVLATNIADPPTGTLRLTIRDDHGMPTPAMVAINNTVTEQPVEFGLTPLRLGIHKRRRFPGYSRRRQWTDEAPIDVDGSRDIKLKAGSYQLHIGKGLEYTPIRQDVQIAAGITVEIDVNLERFVNLPDQGWWPGDDHVHLTRRNTSYDDDLWVMAMAEDIHVVNTLQMGSFLEVQYLQPGFGKEHRVHRGDRVIVPGQEEPRTGRLGHTISLNTTAFIRFADHYFQYERVWKEARRQGAVTGYAHVFGYARDENDQPLDRDGKPINADDWRPEWGRFDSDMGLMLDVPDGYIDFVEVLDNNNRLMPLVWYDLLNLGFRLSASAGSDFPYGCHIGDQRCYVDLGEGNSFNVDAWFEGHRTGRTFVTQGPLIELLVDEEKPGAVLQRSSGDIVRVRVDALGHPDIGSPKTVSLIRFGRTIQSAASADPNQALVSGSWEVEIERSCWLAVRVDAHNGAVAHTSPVYVVVDDQPTLDPSQLRTICEVRLQRIASLRKVMDETITRFEKDGPPVRTRGLTPEQTQQLLYRKWGEMFSTDRDAILDRLARAEKYYSELLKQAD